MEDKRYVSVLIPYKVKDKKVFVFLQKRDNKAKVLPDCFSFFGGKIELGEKPEEALVREIKEELNFNLKEYLYLGQYTSDASILIVLYVYFAKVDDDFENNVTILEGEYGKFFSENEMEKELKLINSDKKILKDLFGKLSA